MRLRVVILVVGLCLSFSALSRADAVYTFNGDVSGARIPGGTLPAGSIFSWSFRVPSLLTTDFTTGSFLTMSVAGGLAGCSIVAATIVAPAGGGVTGTSEVFTELSTPCSRVLGLAVANQFTPPSFHILRQLCGNLS
jgi:hypothetical protein